MSQPKPVTNPNWYEGDVAEEDSKLKLIYPQRRIIYSTEEPVILAPTEFQDPGLVCTPPADRHLTVNAVDVILAGTIAIVMPASPGCAGRRSAGRPTGCRSWQTRSGSGCDSRSRIVARSNSANTPIIWDIALPARVVVSSPLLVQHEIGTGKS